MSLKSAVTAGLLLFVAASIAAPFIRGVATGRRGDAGTLGPQPPDALVVYYLRGNVRCTACRTMEACSREVVEKRYREEAAEGRMKWLAVDYQKPGNEHFATDYQLLTGGVVLVQFRAGRADRWAALPETWNMTGNRAALENYLEGRIRAFQQAKNEKAGP